MDADSRLAAAQHQLDLILSFYGRVDAKLSVVLGIDLAMLGVFFTKVALAKSLPFVVLASGIVFCFLMFGSLLQLFRGSFPDLNGGHSSLVYFREIAKLRESEFRDSYGGLTADKLAEDFLEQSWRNAKILTMKFDRLKASYICMAFATLPWSIGLAWLVAKGS